MFIYFLFNMAWKNPQNNSKNIKRKEGSILNEIETKRVVRGGDAVKMKKGKNKNNSWMMACTLESESVGEIEQGVGPIKEEVRIEQAMFVDGTSVVIWIFGFKMQSF